MTISDISNQSQCGCKGVRFCALCESTDRVLKLRLEEDVYANYEYFVYDENSKNAVKCPSLRSSSTIDEIIQASLSAKYSDYPRLEIEGLTLVTDFLSGSEENYLMDMIDQVNWVQSQSGRRKQDYGPKVNFKQKKLKWTRL
uniref:Phage protein n=1 Tax=Heterorhabditis bacteriophora TaxID=37862 RepID=A0A1I7X6I6_HETBA